MSKFKFKMGRDKWILLVCTGLLLMVVALPLDHTMQWYQGQDKKPAVTTPKPAADEQTATPAAASAKSGNYEEQMEQRVREILKSVEGVGEVDVMIVLKSSEEKVYRVDTSLNTSLTEETDAGGGTRKIDNRDKDESTILTGSGDGQAPILEKEMKPEISGIIISAQGGGSPRIQAEISSAMEALFDLPAHKIKVLKRVE